MAFSDSPLSQKFQNSLTLLTCSAPILHNIGNQDMITSKDSGDRVYRSLVCVDYMCVRVCDYMAWEKAIGTA